MGRSLNKLKDRQVSLFANTSLPEGVNKERLSDGGSLYLVKRGGSASWYFYFTAYGRRREYRIGLYPSVTLKKAREIAHELRLKVAEGINPLEERETQREAQATFGELADKYIELNKGNWGEKTLYQHQKDLTDKCRPIRKLPITEIRWQHIEPLIKPKWAKQPEMSDRLHRRIRAVLDDAIALELIEGRNPADLKGPLGRALPKRPKPVEKHHRALHYNRIPEFMEQIREREGASIRALELLILTCLRSNECRGARWEEIDFETRIWTVPASRMKEGRTHRVPLSDRALEIFNEMKAHRQGPLVFHSTSKTGYVTEQALWSFVRKLKMQGELTVHGFRSSFSTWVTERTMYDYRMAEMALAHKVGTDVERAYQRSDMLERRFKLMDEWAAFCNGAADTGLIGEQDNVVALRV